ncbi:MAG: DUF3769 domain-containing protein [Elainellaceae cyanobacterium]
MATVPHADTLSWPEASLLAEAERQVLLPEPMAPRALSVVASTLIASDPAVAVDSSKSRSPESRSPRLPGVELASAETGSAEADTADAGATDIDGLGPPVEVGLPGNGSLPGSQLGDLYQDHGLDEERAIALEADAQSRLAADEAVYEEAAVLLHESRDLLSELVDWVAQQPEAQDPIPSDFQAPLPTLDPAAPAQRPSATPETNAIPLEELELDDPAEGAASGVADGIDALEVISDRQVYDRQQQSFIAEGNVALTVRGSVLLADEVRVNLPNQIAIATGNVVFTRGEQVLRGDRIEYNFVREEGAILDARGEVFIPQIASDLSGDRPVDDPSAANQRAGADVGVSNDDVLSARLSRQQPEVQTATAVGGVTIGAGISSTGGNVDQGSAAGSVRQLRFEAERIDFRPGGWVAANVRLTNDPFSPPELEIRTNQATFQRLSATRSELRLRNPRLVIDRGLTIPLLRSRYVFDQRQQDPLPVQFGFDEEDRDGLFAEREFEVIDTPVVRFSFTPQFFIQRAFTGRDEDDIEIGEDDTGVLNPNSYGLTAELDAAFDSLTSLEASTILTSLDFDSNFADEDLRGLVRLRRSTPSGYTFTGEYSYRDRLFNGTLGFQTVDQSFGVIATSPAIPLGNSGAELTYQGSVQRITDDIRFERRDDLLGPILEREDNNTTLTRYQVAAEVRRPVTLWAGTPLPATPDQGLRYTPTPVVPFLALNPRVRGVAGFYSSGDTQPILTGELSLFGQFGHFSRPAFDYLGFNLTYRRSTEGSESPFTFDRVQDREVVSGGLTAQLIGPFRVGFQTSISLSEDEDFDTSYFVEYSRRTFGVLFRFNPDREIGSLNLRISDFAWTGTPRRFDAEPIDYEPELVDPATVDFPTGGTTEGVPVTPEPAEPASPDPIPSEPAPIEAFPIEEESTQVEPTPSPAEPSPSLELDLIEDDPNETSAPPLGR